MTESGEREALQSPRGKNILISTGIAVAVAALVLLAFILPAEYGVDPLGIGRALGIEGMSAGATQTIEIVDTIGGNETIREIQIPDFGDPVPLPNPNVHQPLGRAPETRTLTVSLDVDAETEVKAVLGENRMITYQWSVDDGIVYSDFHGHNPEFGDDFWVRYQEDQRGSSGQSGSLVAPFAGEHGWYWVNLSDHPVTVSLTVTGFFDEIVDYSNAF